MMEIKYHVPSKSYIYHKLINQFLDDHRNYTSKQITKNSLLINDPYKKNILKQLPNPTNLGQK